MNIVKSCLYNLPLSVAHVQPEIVGDPKIRVFTIVTVINEKHAITIQGKGYIRTLHINILEQKMLVFIANVSSAHSTNVCLWTMYYLKKTF